MALPAVVAVYLAWLADEGLAYPSVERAYAGIASRLRGREGWTAKGRPEAVTQVLRGIRRKRPHTARPKAPLTVERLVGCLAGLSLSPLDRALLLVGFAGALRRSELVGLDVADVTVTPGVGVDLRLWASKTDKTDAGRVVSIPVASNAQQCPVLALAALLELHRTTGGPVFMKHGRRVSDRYVARLVKRVTQGQTGDFGGHSLRSGFVTTAAGRGVDFDAIMRQTGHKRIETARGYIRYVNRFEHNAMKGIL